MIIDKTMLLKRKNEALDDLKDARDEVTRCEAQLDLINELIDSLDDILSEVENIDAD